MHSNSKAAEAFKNSSSLMADIWRFTGGTFFEGVLTKLFGPRDLGSKNRDENGMARYGVDA